MTTTTNLLRIKEVADLLGVTTRTVYRRIWAGELPATKLGGLYYIKRTDLDALMQGGLQKIEETSSENLMKCGVCLRVLRSPDQVAAKCAAQGCEALICKRCASDGHLRCRNHRADTGERLAQAQSALETGEISLLVRGSQARLREMNYLNRIRGRLARIETLVHPKSSALLSINTWEGLLTQGDERAELLRLKGKVLLDTKDTAELPLNAWILYRIPQMKEQVALPLDIQVRVLSRLPKMVADGFDTLAYNQDELSRMLVKLSDSLSAEATFRVVVLAATCGWDGQARRVVIGSAEKGNGSAFSHPNLLLYLYDLETNELIYQSGDSRLGQYAELFKPILLTEEVADVKVSIENLLISTGHTSLTLQDAAKALPYAEWVIKESFLDMEKSGRYRVVDLADLGIALQQKSII